MEDSYFQALAECKTKAEYHALVQKHFREKHPDYYKAYMKVYMKQYYHLHKKKPCEHITKIDINPNYDAVKLICVKCGVLLAKC